MQKFNSKIEETLGFFYQNIFGIFISFEALQVNEHKSIIENFVLSDNFDYSSQESLELFTSLRKQLAIEHETKHFHDFLFAPFCQYFVRKSFVHIFGLSDILDAFKSPTSKEINIEIPLYLSLKDKGYDTENFEGLIKFSDNLQIKNIFNINIIDIIEGLAVCFEIQLIHTMIGNDQAIFYFNYILSHHDKLSQYSNAIYFLYKKLNIQDMHIIHKILFYSLCGDVELEGIEAFPHTRLEKIIIYILHKVNNEKYPDNIGEIIDQFYNEMKISHPKETIKTSQKYLDEEIKFWNPLKFKLTSVNNVKFYKSLFQYSELRQSYIDKDDFLESYLNLYDYLDFNLLEKPTVYFYPKRLNSKRLRTVRQSDEMDVILWNSNNKDGFSPILFSLKSFDKNVKLKVEPNLVIHMLLLNIMHLKDINQIKNNWLFNFISIILKTAKFINFTQYRSSHE